MQGLKKKSTLSWVMEFAGRKKSYFGGSVVLAILGVAVSFLPYLIISMIVSKLISGNKEADYYLKMALIMPRVYLRTGKRI